jgi:hypothetical protein
MELIHIVIFIFLQKYKLHSIPGLLLELFTYPSIPKRPMGSPNLSQEMCSLTSVGCGREVSTSQ